MKMKSIYPVVAVLLLSTLNSPFSTVFAQGSLTPPGVPAPTMKSLDQVQPRTPISSVPYTITNSGSYYLTTNLIGVSGQHGIVVLAENVSIDLNGFALIGTNSALSGIQIPFSVNNIFIGNGTVRNWGIHGVNAGGASGSIFERLRIYFNAGTGLQVGANCRVDGCTLTFNGAGIGTAQNCVVNGCTVYGNNGSGLFTGNNCSIAACTIYQNNYGISAATYCLVKDCTAYANTNAGITAGNYSTIDHCTANLNQTGISGGGNNLILACAASLNSSNGIAVLNGCTIKDCIVSQNAGSGIRVGNNCLVTGNNATSNGNAGITNLAGIYATGSDNQVVDNTATSNSRGIKSDGGYNLIIKNKVTLSSAADFDVTANDRTGPVSGTAATNSPWANFSY